MNKKTTALTTEQYKEIIQTMREGFCGCRPNERIATTLVLEGNLGLRISDIVKLRLCDVVRDGERAVRAAAFGVHHALGDTFAVEVGEDLLQGIVLEQDGAAGAHGHRVFAFVLCERASRIGGQRMLVVVRSFHGVRVF